MKISDFHQNRREWLSFAAGVAGAAVLPVSRVYGQSPPAAQAAPSTATASRSSVGLSVNWDNAAFFVTRSGAIKGTAAHSVDVSTLNQVVDQYAHTEVTSLVFSVNSQKTSYATKAKGWQSMWKGFASKKGANQPLLESTAAASRPEMYEMLRYAWEYEQKGLDVYAAWIDRCRKWGISPWLSMRMNDIHYTDDERSWAHSDMWRSHPEFRISKAGGLNYEAPEVRERSMALIDELIDRYQFDGLELDWMRFPNANFKFGKFQEGAKMLTDFTREVREKLTKKRGKSAMLGARVPSHPDAALGWGFDAVAWAKPGLVDRLVVTPMWATIEFDIPRDQWKSLVAGSNVKIQAGLEGLIRPFPDSPLRIYNTIKTARGAAASLLDLGADGIYLYNYFDTVGYSSMPDISDYPLLLTEAGSLKTLVGKARRQILTYQDFVAPGQKPEVQLPVDVLKAKTIALRLATGPKPAAGQSATVRLGITGIPADAVPAWKVEVNGVPAKYRGIAAVEPPKPTAPLYEFAVVASSMKDRYNVINVVPKLPAPGSPRIEWAEIAIGSTE
jgi:hypothetical protein